MAKKEKVNALLVLLAVAACAALLAGIYAILAVRQPPPGVVPPSGQAPVAAPEERPLAVEEVLRLLAGTSSRDVQPPPESLMKSLQGKASKPQPPPSDIMKLLSAPRK